MAIPSEYVQIIGLYAMALFHTIITFRRTKSLDQITLSNNKPDHIPQLRIPEANNIKNFLSPINGI
jgi:hypothetical protein